MQVLRTFVGLFAEPIQSSVTCRSAERLSVGLPLIEVAGLSEGAGRAPSQQGADAKTARLTGQQGAGLFAATFDATLSAAFADAIRRIAAQARRTDCRDPVGLAEEAAPAGAVDAALVLVTDLETGADPTAATEPVLRIADGPDPAS